MDYFFAFARRFGSVSNADLEYVLEKAQRLFIPQGDFFLKPGQICHNIGFVTEGVLRTFIIDEQGKELIRNFPSEYSFVVDLNSYHNRIPSVEYWEALTDIHLLLWDRSTLECFERNIASWHAVTTNMTQKILLDNALERTEMFSDDASTRYRKFMERYPEDLVRIPLRHLANYLGIAPQSLSRIRQQMGKR